MGWVDPDSPAHAAGLREGDRVIMANEDKTVFWTDFQIAASLNKTLDLKILRGGEIHYLYGLPTETGHEGFRHLAGVVPVVDISAAELTQGGAAELAGLQPGDLLLAYNGTPIRSGRQFIGLVQAGRGQTAELLVRAPQGGAERLLSVTPLQDPESGRWLMGIFLGYGERIDHPEPITQMRYFSGTIIRTFRAFGRPKERVEAAKSIGGPVMILSGMHSQVRFHPMQALWFTALININLAIINLMPLIILDGGHIMVALYEWIVGRPPHKALITAMANVMVVFLIGMMVFLSFRDVRLLEKIHGGQDEPAAPSAPAAVEATPTP